MFTNFFKITIRNLWKNKTYSFVNIFGLSIGIACAGLIFLWVENELTWDNQNVNKNQLYQLEVNTTSDGNNFTMESTPRPLGKAMQREIPGITNTARVSDQGQRLLFNAENKSLYTNGLFADASLLTMFSFNFIEGNAKNPFPQLYSLILNESTAKKFFPDEKNIVGKIIRVDNKHDYVVSGVVKDMPENSTLQFDWLAPYDVSIAEMKELAAKFKITLTDDIDWGSYGPLTYVQLDNNASLATINTQLKDFIHRKVASQTSKTFLFPMSQWHLHSEFANGKPTGGGAIAQVRLLSIIAWIILLIACINFMNLATANSQKRAREIGVRKVLGAGRKKLIIQFIGEALLMSAIAALVALFIITISLPAFNSLMQKQLQLQLLHPSHIISLFIIIIVCGFIAGSYPSVFLSSFNPVFVLKGLKIKTGSAAFIRKGLVVFQFAVSMIFIVSTLVVYQQIQHVKNRDIGFNKNSLIEINPENDVSKIFPLIKNDLLNTGFVQNVALADHPTLYGGNTDDRFKWQGKLPGNNISIAYRNVSAEFINTSGMKIIDGKNFTADASSLNSNIIINESMAKLMGNGNAVGKIIQTTRGNSDNVFTNLTVIGVIKDYLYGNIYDGKAAALILLCKPPEDQCFLYIKLKAQKNTDQILSTIQAVMKKDNAAYPLEYKFVDEQFNEMFSNETQVSKVSAVFASLAIIISCLGLFGLATFTAERRIKEIGIRKVLGASVSGITALLTKDFLQLVVVACFVAFPLSWWMMHNWLQNYEYRIAISWWIFTITGAAAIFVAIITVSFQAIKSAMANPVTSLKTE